MTQKTLLKKVNTLKTLEERKKAIEKQMEIIQEEVKQELQARGTEEEAVGDWMVRFKAVISNKFNARAFAADHPKLYQKYMGQSQTMRFTVK